MDATPSVQRKKKQNWKYLEITGRDIQLMKTIVEQKFLTRTHVIEGVFRDAQSYAKVRIRKLKKFGYLKAVKKGERIVILDRRTPVADLIPHNENLTLPGWKRPIEKIKTKGPSFSETVSKMRDRERA